MILEFWAGKVQEFLVIYHTSGILEDKNAERNEDDGGLPWDIAERSKEGIGAIFVLCWIQTLEFLVMMGLKE